MIRSISGTGSCDGPWAGEGEILPAGFVFAGSRPDTVGGVGGDSAGGHFPFMRGFTARGSVDGTTGNESANFQDPSSRDDGAAAPRRTKVELTWLAHPDIDTRDALRTPGTYPRRLLVGTALWAVGVTALAWGLAVFASPCGVVLAVDSFNCDAPITGIIRTVENLNFVGCFMVLLYFYLSKSIEAGKMLREKRDGSKPGLVDTTTLVQGGEELFNGRRKRAKKAYSLPASHWTAAASRDVYEHFSLTIQNARLFIAPFLATSVALIGGGHIYALAVGKSLAAPHPGQEVCPPGVNMCQVAWHCDDILLVFNVSILLYNIITLILAPRLIWSPATMEAARQTGDWRLRRLCHLHVHLVFPIAADMFIVLSYALVDPYVYIFVQHIVFFGNATVVAYLTALLVWQHHPLGETAPGVVNDTNTKSLDGRARRVSRFVRGMLRSPEAGSRFQQETVVAVVACLFTGRENFEVYASMPVLMAVYWLLRIAALLFLLPIRDEVMDWERLEPTGAAFGMVVDAGDLFRAVSHTLRYGTPYPRLLRTYKASLLRMQETMSISYRWQEQQEHIARNVSVNMSTWQLQTVLDALCQSTCKYVWIDKVSVHQEQGYLQETLLSRMMAVYASSGCTLVLRSAETEGSRYHQRGWTVQEFCACNKVCILTEPRLDPSSTGSSRSVRVSRLRISVRGFARSPNSEETFFLELRQWHLARVAECRPFWLYHTVNDDAHVALGKFFELSERVSTQEPADMIRALIPLLTNCPVETQRELLAVLRQLEERGGMSLQDQLDLFASQAGGYRRSHTVRIMLHDDSQQGRPGAGLTVARVASHNAGTRVGWAEHGAPRPAGTAVGETTRGGGHIP
eukprot:CAMPEP_0177790824 /NCGR_PEP_ID=MMETSP0491_2-20121128/23577_1 /TAXON_ID=63592 /ORGANISM="Tetraselmis chuii, Strain PLY429" /LENGTH=855 /DNA_ID=CAMNT_0019312957 /DNA_START=68 /DNA_END=2635 /DNA_ORIENTATION=+